jgi:hypothetical protein
MTLDAIAMGYLLIVKKQTFRKENRSKFRSKINTQSCMSKFTQNMSSNVKRDQLTALSQTYRKTQGRRRGKKFLTSLNLLIIFNLSTFSIRNQKARWKSQFLLQMIYLFFYPRLQTFLLRIDKIHKLY